MNRSRKCPTSSRIAPVFQSMAAKPRAPWWGWGSSQQQQREELIWLCRTFSLQHSEGNVWHFILSSWLHLTVLYIPAQRCHQQVLSFVCFCVSVSPRPGREIQNVSQVILWSFVSIIAHKNFSFVMLQRLISERGGDRWKGGLISVG